MKCSENKFWHLWLLAPLRNKASVLWLVLSLASNQHFWIICVWKKKATTELSTSEDRKFCFWLLKKRNKINHLCWINHWLWLTHECFLVLAPRWDKWDTFMWLDCLTCRLSLCQGLPKNNCYWVEKSEDGQMKSSVHSTTSSAVYLFVTKWRWKHQQCREGKTWVNLFAPEPRGPSLLRPRAPTREGCPAPPRLCLPAVHPAVLGQKQPEEKVGIVWSVLCSLITRALASSCCKTANTWDR